MATNDDLGIPGLTSKDLSGSFDPAKYSVKYFKADLGDDGDVLVLQEIETRGVRGKDVLILSLDKFTFMDRYLVVVKYLEKNE